MAELASVADERMDLVVQAAGVPLGTRPADEHDPRHKNATYGARMLLSWRVSTRVMPRFGGGSRSAESGVPATGYGPASKRRPRPNE